VNGENSSAVGSALMIVKHFLDHSLSRGSQRAGALVCGPGD
jgi:hypothetical protein